MTTGSVFFLQTQHNPRRWERVNAATIESRYTKNRIVVFQKDDQRFFDVMAHDITAEDLQAGIEAAKTAFNQMP